MSAQYPPGPPPGPGGPPPSGYPGASSPGSAGQTAGTQPIATGSSPAAVSAVASTVTSDGAGLGLASFVLGVVSMMGGGSPLGAGLFGGDGWLFLIGLLVPLAGAALGFLALRPGATAADGWGRRLAVAGIALSVIGAVVMFLGYLRLELAAEETGVFPLG